MLLRLDSAGARSFFAEMKKLAYAVAKFRKLLKTFVGKTGLRF